MILTLEQYRTLTGDTDSSGAVVQRLLDKYTSAIETYCHRRFGLFAGSETHFDVNRDPLILNNRPVSEVSAVVAGNADTAPTNIHYALGWLYHNNAWAGKTVTVTYVAGLVAPIGVREILVSLVSEALAGVGDSSRPVVKETVFGVDSVTYGEGVNAHPILGAYASALDPWVEYRVG